MSMLFLSKLLPLLFAPLGIALLLGLWALLALIHAQYRRSALGFGLVWLALWLMATPAVNQWLRQPLEWRHLPVAVEESPSAQAIVVLGGAVSGQEFPRKSLDLSAQADRLFHAARLFKAGKAPVVVATGGFLPWDNFRRPEAEAMALVLRELGVPGEAILLENRSANTWENARRTKALLDPLGLNRILLVTSALHMERASRTFRHLGFEVIVSTTDVETVSRKTAWPFRFLPDATVLASSTSALKEMAGLLYYRARGWLS
ncbi:MAG: YdcF family protein [Magnetococcales bacterium]|nr:YdcF family protein [Magnetococcales bacterium]